MHLSLPKGTSPVGLHGHYFLHSPPQLRDLSLFHASGLDQPPSVLSSSQPPSGVGNLIQMHDSFPSSLGHALESHYLSNCLYCSTDLLSCQPVLQCPFSLVYYLRRPCPSPTSPSRPWRRPLHLLPERSRSVRRPCWGSTAGDCLCSSC